MNTSMYACMNKHPSHRNFDSVEIFQTAKQIWTIPGIQACFSLELSLEYFSWYYSFSEYNILKKEALLFQPSHSCVWPPKYLWLVSWMWGGTWLLLSTTAMPGSHRPGGGVGVWKTAPPGSTICSWGEFHTPEWKRLKLKAMKNPNTSL